MKVVAVDQGTTGTKSFTLHSDGDFVRVAALEHRQIYPQPGWVEHDAEELLTHVSDAIAAAGTVDAIGIDNQGETVVAWDSRTGKPVHNAIVWQDDRTKDVTAKLKAQDAEELTRARAGLPLDPYFSASKLRWFLDHVDDAKSLLRQGRLRLGTSDAFFLDRLTGVFATDVSTASRTSLMNLDNCVWDEELCKLFGVPLECLPEIRSTTGSFGEIKKTRVTASVVDQQAALFGHGCSKPGDTKITFGTGAFALAITGPTRITDNKLGISPTLAWRIGDNPPVFAIEGGVYNAASSVNWARELGLFSSFAEIDSFDRPPAITRDIAFVPALSGLACPHWDRNAAGLWIGMGLDTTRSDMMQSLLEGVALRVAEVIAAMGKVIQLPRSVSVDGGMAKNAYLLRFLADALATTVVVPSITDVTAMGTARLAMMGLGAETLPPLPEPKKTILARTPLSREAKNRFSEAVLRSKGWKM